MKNLTRVLMLALMVSLAVSCKNDDPAPPVPTITSFSPASAGIGTPMTITGSNFSATPANNIVKFGSITATVTASTETTITTSPPIGATTGSPISVTVNGVTGTSTTPFTLATIMGSWTLVTQYVTGCSDPNDNDTPLLCSGNCITTFTATTLTFDGLTSTYTSSAGGATITCSPNGYLPGTHDVAVTNTTLTLTSESGLGAGCKQVFSFVK